MRLLIIVSFLAVATTRCFAQVSAEPQYPDLRAVRSSSGPYLLAWDGPQYTKVTIYGREETPLYSSPLLSGNQRRCLVWAIDTDGIAARACEVRRGGNMEATVELLDRTGKTTNVMQTGAYIPQHLAFAPDHTLWTVGFEQGYERQAEDFNVVHHYAQNRQEIGQGLPWRQIAGDFNAYTSLQLCVGGKWLFAANDRIGFMPFLHSGRGEWVEIGPGGNILEIYDLGRYGELSYTPVAMTPSGSVFARIIKERQFQGWAVLDRSKGIWRKITGCPKGTMIGTDGENLIFAENDGAWTILHSAPSGSLRLELYEWSRGLKPTAAR